MLENREGKNNPNWKGGISDDKYRYKQIQKKRYPRKVDARQRHWKDVDSGKEKKGKCAVCGSRNATAHHKSYNGSSDVIWLCKKHHQSKHDGKGVGKKTEEILRGRDVDLVIGE